jgi:hypothetical protein
VTVAVALFVAVWTGLYIQLVSGHDPALASEATPVAQSANPVPRPTTAGATTPRPIRGATTAAMLAHGKLLSLHARRTRFDPASELSRMAIRSTS